MTIDLRTETADFRNYLSARVGEQVRMGNAKPGLIHVGFYFDQDGWLTAYFDSRPAASRDGEWTIRLTPETLLMRPHWHEASDLADLRDLKLIGTDGNEIEAWAANPTFQQLAETLGEFIQSSVSSFEKDGLFRPLLGLDPLNYCVEELTGLYSWPLNPEIVKLISTLRGQGTT